MRPLQILRKRLNKENDDTYGAKLNKRNKLANRRVSFAPDEELETKHIFKERGRASGGEDDEVRNRWGFNPGADDTLEVSFGRAVMGETTYNHVYGGASTGDITRAIKDGQTGAPPARPGLHGGLGDATAVSSSAAELRRLAAQDSTNMSMELPGLEGNGTSNDLLGDSGGLSLEAFALPPEPGAQVASHLQGPEYPQRDAAGEGLTLGRAGLAHGAGIAAPVSSRPPVSKLTCQEFLGIIDVSFNDKVCRMSYLPQSDPPPKTVAEVYEAAILTAPHVDTYQAMMIEVSGRLASMQSRVQQLEGELTATNSELFAAVQLLPSAQLETIKEQFISLKKLCRIRTVKAIKQTHLNALDDLLAQLDTGKAQLQAEMAAMTADAERFKQCVQDKNALTAAITRRCQEDEDRLQEGIQRRKTVEGHLQRLEALRAQNVQRLQRLQAAQAERQAVEQNRVPKELLIQERGNLEARSAALVTRASTSALTPGRESQMARSVAARREEVEALLALHALRIDLVGMEHTGRFSVTYKGIYQMACAASGSSCAITVEGPHACAQYSSLDPSITAQLRASASGLGCCIPSIQLAIRMEAVMRQLHRLWRLSHQLETCWLKHSCMQKPLVEQQSPAGRPVLLLQFLNADTVTKVSIRIPWQAALLSDSVAPELQVQMHSLDPAEMQQQYCEALHGTVLSKLTPSASYLSALCFTMSATLHVPSDAAQAQVAGADRSSSDTGSFNRTPLPLPSGGGHGVGRVFDNPLFTSPTMDVKSV
ncbi:hypothetical protein GPECTOR_2g1458 [Gonium pectorale]|uniref:Spc7 kinetochore protein domain-containing protein n=1 Tax=Gonium pectorale TaxID=33097 RepID=A0A150H175_GONPE|nr:hypothetical protein GPECTOR_2g1458 [Gonium pectorale]|eukprot:KXZ55907.1 hypothetical protein GPECTOR_2g1458 [Gonium pectorale]